MLHKKRLSALVMAALMLSSCASAKKAYTKVASDKTVINIWSSDEDLAGIVHCFLVNFPEFAEKYEIVPNVISRYMDEYETSLSTALSNGEETAPDIYIVPSDLAARFCQGEDADLAASYDQFFPDLDARLEDSQIAPYTVEVGTRPSDGKVVGLSYEGGQGMMIYRRSIAKEVWGSDDPAVVSEHIGGGTGNWDKYLEAAEELRDAGYAALSGYEDLWNVFYSASDKPWKINDELYIDPQREAYLDLARTLRISQFTNNHGTWTEEWYHSMEDRDDRRVFGYFGTLWFINDIVSYYACAYDGDEDQAPIAGTYGDWGVCTPPESFWWGGSWVMVGKQVVGSEKEEGVKKLLEYMTLDYTPAGLQHVIANGYLYGYEGLKNSVPSSKVLLSADGSMPILGGQNPLPLIEQENAKCVGGNLHEKDGKIYNVWSEQVKQYVDGGKTREETLSDFRSEVINKVDLEPEK
ncbi:MAG: carbohydrate ABC transporter substrate-binding protein [Clostridiales bacterium]|nr:carbohydrate ABC transporter substrate-binding protein [Clostridiales bacterium]